MNIMIIILNRNRKSGKKMMISRFFGLLAELNFVGDNGDIVIIINIIIHIQTVALFTDI